MASLMYISRCMSMFFILNFNIEVSAEKIGSNADWKLALQKIDELQKTVSKQNERISILEKRHTESEVQTVAELQNTVKQQSDQIAQLESRIKELETVAKAEEVISVETPRNEPLSERNGTYFTPNKTFNRRGIFETYWNYLFINCRF